VTGEETFDSVFPAAVLGDYSKTLTGKPIKSVGELDKEKLYKVLLSALGDENAKVRMAGVSASSFMDVSFVQPKLFHYLDTDGDGEADADRADRTAASMAMLMGILAKKSGDAAMAAEVSERIAALLVCPSIDVQVGCADGIAAAITVLPQDQAIAMLKKHLGALGETPAKVAAFGVAGCVKGLTSRSLVAHGVLDALETAASNKKDPKQREGAMAGYEALPLVLKSVFEPYSLRMLPAVIKAIGDKTPEVRAQADASLRAIMDNVSNHGLRAVLTLVAEQIQQSGIAWQAKTALLDVICKKVKEAPTQAAMLVHFVVPAVITTLTDTKPEVQAGAKKALTVIGTELIQSPEMKAMVPALTEAILSPATATKDCIEKLMDVTFINAIDRPCLSIMVPVLSRALKEQKGEYKRRASMVVGNMCGLVIDGKELVPYVPALLPELVGCVRDSNPEMRQYGAVALAALLKGMASAHLSSRFDLLLQDLEQLQKDMVSDKADVRQGAEQKLNELIEMATQSATRTHHSEEEVAADLEKMKLEDEKRAREKAAEEEAARKKAQHEEAVILNEVAVPGKGFCDKICRGCMQCKLALEEQAQAAEIAKKEADRLAKIEAAAKAEEDKKKAMKKFEEQKKAALLKQKSAKKKK